MAIDDNTSYELTGAQVKDLANKIKAKAADNIFVGATSAIPGSKGLVPQPQAGDDTKFLSGDGTWKTVSTGQTYSAGNGIDITNNTISIDTSVVAEVTDIPAKTSDLINDGADGTSTYVEYDDLATVATSGSYNDLFNKPIIPSALTAGNHIDITNNVISAEGYVWADTPTPATTPTGTITSGMIADGTITAADIATGVVPTITLSTTDIGEGAPLAANTLYGVYQ